MAALFYFLLCCVASCVTVVQADALAADTLFQIDFSTDEKGGCATIGRQKIQRLLDESETLARIGSDLIGDFGKEDEATRLINSFVHDNNRGHRTTLKSGYEEVQRFLTTDAGSGGDRPYLLCSDNWLVRQTMSDDARDNTGSTFPLVVPDNTPALIKDVPDLVKMRKASAGKTPYYSYLHLGYLFDYRYATGSYCRQPGSKAVTSDLLLPPTLTLCPRSFEPDTHLGTVEMKPLSSSMIPNDPEAIPGNSQKLGDILPTSVTLFHELFHLVLGAHNTIPETGREQYRIIDMGKMAPSDAALNPETYAVMAVAYFYTRSVEPVNGHKVEFYGFFTTRN